MALSPLQTASNFHSAVVPPGQNDHSVSDKQHIHGIHEQRRTRLLEWSQGAAAMMAAVVDSV